MTRNSAIDSAFESSPPSLSPAVNGSATGQGISTNDPFQFALEMSPTAVLLAQLDGLKLTWANAAALRFLQVSPTELTQYSLADFVARPWLDKFWQAIADLESGDIACANTWLTSHDLVSASDETRAAEDLCEVKLGISSQQFVVVGQSLPQLHASESSTDALTGLPDRRSLMKRIRSAIARNHRHCGLLFIDLVRFKAINDQLGHIVGDQVLAGFARRLRSGSRPEDLVVRYGGDEFVVLVDRVASLQELNAMAERISAEISYEFETEAGKSMRVQCTAGAALLDAEMNRPSQLIAAADRDMYRRKRAHPNS